MRNHRKEAGIIAIEVILFVFLALVVAGVGYKVLHARGAVEDANGNIDASQTVNKTTPALQQTQAPDIKSKADLDAAGKALDQTSPDDNSSDLNQLNQQMSF
jgi:hypothetical protein